MVNEEKREELTEELAESNDKDYKVISITLPNEIGDMLKRFCENEKRKRSNAITVIVDEYLTNYLKNTEQ